jgi:hypothetical protein
MYDGTMTQMIEAISPRHGDRPTQMEGEEQQRPLPQKH